MKTTYTIKDFYNRLIGYIETDDRTGDKVGKDFYHRIVGYYNKKQNVTTDFYRKIISRGDMLSSLITEDSRK